ncbi:clarin-3-like isoform X4 [Varroa destructor]|uniref:Uncharacterized protein n=1 Tax=Varroa destructor TaxID=109461 RepID=A0A7M7KHK9_VARDE|nr:clarin-3-like isoform X4 [Varroa destructor]
MDARARFLTFLTFLISCLAICLLSASLLTHNWLVAKVRMVRDTTIDSVFLEQEGVHPVDNDKFHGTVQFGLFYGKKVLNYGYGPRATGFSMKEVFRADPELMHYPLYICTVVGIAFALFFTIIGSVLSVVNSVMTPVEKINGAVGLYTWNGLSVSTTIIPRLTAIASYEVTIVKG